MLEWVRVPKVERGRWGVSGRSTLQMFELVRTNMSKVKAFDQDVRRDYYVYSAGVGRARRDSSAWRRRGATESWMILK